MPRVFQRSFTSSLLLEGRYVIHCVNCEIIKGVLYYITMQIAQTFATMRYESTSSVSEERLSRLTDGLLFSFRMEKQQ